MTGAISRVTAILCRPSEGGNLGASCRAMKTMGITALRVAGPLPPDMDVARVRAHHAADVLDRSERFDSLEQAVRGLTLVAGVTRRAGRRRKYVRLTPEELAEHVAAAPAARVGLVFGNEEAGLSDEELSHCNLAVMIPSSPLFPSLNLSHAVQIVAYALYRRLAGEPDTPAAPEQPATRLAGRCGTDFAFGGASMDQPAPLERVTEVAAAMVAPLDQAGFFRQGNQEELRGFLRDILARSWLASREADRLERTFRTLAALIRASGAAPGDQSSPPRPH